MIDINKKCQHRKIMPIHNSNGLTYLTFDYFDQYQIPHGIFMRHGGMSPQPWSSLNMATSVGDSKKNVIENRKRITGSLGLDYSSIYDLWQVHSNNVVTADRPRLSGQPHIQGDAIITNQQNVSLLMLFADCVPILLFDKKNNVAAIAHAGWQGTINGIVLNVVQNMMDKFNSNPEDIMAGIGPAICAQHYEVGNDVVNAVRKSKIDQEQALITVDSRYYLDLKKANFLLLEQANIKMIESMDICTACHPDDWFSHRAENKMTGRFGAIISLDS